MRLFIVSKVSTIGILYTPVIASLLVKLTGLIFKQFLHTNAYDGGPIWLKSLKMYWEQV